jgi:hypothetical protein
MKNILKHPVFFTLFFFHTQQTVFGQMQVDKKHFIDLLNAGHYDSVYYQAKYLRENVYGKNAVLDYFIAKSLCLDGYGDKAIIKFSRIINDYHLSGNKLSFIEKEILSCTLLSPATETVAEENDFRYLNNIPLPTASVGGKLGRVYDCFGSKEFMDNSHMKAEAELQERLFFLTQKKQALQKIKIMVGDNYSVDTTGRYLFVTLKNFNLSNKQVKAVAGELEKAYNFFISFYRLRPPDKLLTVYILPNQQSLQQTAAIVHGLQLPLNSLGYSCLSDLSLLGLSDAGHVGTLFHELFHLMIRTDVGDIPAWLDEGLACLYSTYTWENNQLRGAGTWRTSVLKEAANAGDNFLQLPSLKQLVNFSWSEFDGSKDKNICKAAINYAWSNHFMLYLQDKNMLQKTVKAFKEKKDVERTKEKKLPEDNVAIVETVMADSIAGIELQFLAWFKSNFNFDPNHKEVSFQKSVSFYDKVTNLQVMMDIIDNGDGSSKRDSIKAFRNDLEKLEQEYRQNFLLSDEESSNAGVSMNQAARVSPVLQQESPDQKMKRELNEKLNRLEKRIRAVLFPPTAN